MKLFISLIFCLAAMVFGRGGKDGATINGFVLDGSNQEAVIGANVYIEDLLIGAATNVSGYFVISDVPFGTIELTTTYLGYKTDKRILEIKPGENVRLNITLVEDIAEFEAIVVTADSISISEKLFAKEISTVNLSAIQINSVPQVAEADLLRTLQTLPGIVPLSDYSSALYIRGGTPDQNLYLIDGTDVYNPEHAFGLFSTFNTDAIKQVDLSKGGFSADRGGRLSSIIDVTNQDGNREEFEGSASISLLSAKTTLQMPLGEMGSLSGSIRRTYFDKTIGAAIEGMPDYYFYDGNVKAFLDLNANNKLTLSAYSGHDVLDFDFNQNDDSDLGLKYDWGNITSSAKWTHVFTPKLFSNFWITASRFSSYFKFQGFDASERNELTDLTTKGSLEYHQSNNLNLKFGFEQKNLRLKYFNNSPGVAVRIDPVISNSIGYISTNWMPNTDWDIQTGIRFNYFNADQNYYTFAPRFAVKRKIDDKSSVKFSTGVYHQFLHSIPRFFVASIWTSSGKELEPSSSNHFILGYQRELNHELQFELETYYKTYKNTYSYDQNADAVLTTTEYNNNGDAVFRNVGSILNKGDGHSFGFEALLRKDVGIVTGWAAYSFASTKNTINSINQGKAFTPRHDRTHTVNIISNIDLDNSFGRLFNKPFSKDSSSWNLGLNLVYSSGQPITEPGSAYLGVSAPGDPVRDTYFHPTAINQMRLPYYARLDLSVTWAIQFRSWKMAPYLQIYNIGNRKNIWFASYDYKDGAPDYSQVSMFGILPTMGINFEF